MGSGVAPSQKSPGGRLIIFLIKYVNSLKNAYIYKYSWCSVIESNNLPLACQASTLTNELTEQCIIIFPKKMDQLIMNYQIF